MSRKKIEYYWLLQTTTFEDILVASIPRNDSQIEKPCDHKDNPTKGSNSIII